MAIPTVCVFARPGVDELAVVTDQRGGVAKFILSAAATFSVGDFVQSLRRQGAPCWSADPFRRGSARISQTAGQMSSVDSSL